MTVPLTAAAARTRNAYAAVQDWRAEVQALQALAATCSPAERDVVCDQLERADQSYVAACRRHAAAALAEARLREGHLLRSRGWD